MHQATPDAISAPTAHLNRIYETRGDVGARDLPPRFDCRGRNWPEDPGACVIEHLRKHDVVPESGETVVETPHVSPTVVRRAGFFVVVVLGPVVWVVASRC